LRRPPLSATLICVAQLREQAGIGADGGFQAGKVDHDRGSGLIIRGPGCNPTHEPANWGWVCPPGK